MTPEQLEAVEANLSSRAVQLLKRLRRGKFYKTYASDTPAAMDELAKVGLVETAGRVETLVSAFVPIEHKPLYENIQKAQQELYNAFEDSKRLVKG